LQGADVLLTIAELAVAFAGFASVVVLFQHRDPRQWPPAVVVRLRTMIESSLATLFSALFPLILYHFGLSGGMLWTACSLLLALSLAATSAVIWRRSRGPLARGDLSRPFSATVFAITVLVFVVLLLNAGEVLFHQSFGPYLLGVSWHLVFASLMFLRVVMVPADPSSSG